MSWNGNYYLAGSTVLCLALLMGFYYQNKESISEHDRLENILSAMLKIESGETVSPNTRIAVGYGACRDLSSLGRVVIPAPESSPATKAHHHTVTSMQQLQELYAFFFAAGSAAERYVSNKSLFSELVTAAELHPGHWYQVGGNGPVMSSRFAVEGATVLLAARSSAALAASLPSNVTVSGSSGRGDLGSDDVHILLEYGRGETWAGHSSPRANRLILHSDSSNPLIESAEEFGPKLKKFSPHLFVVSGLQMMDNFPFKKGEVSTRLDVVQQQMTSAGSSGTLVHFELASFTDAALLQLLIRELLPHAHSIGMNEQELPNLHSLLLHGNVSLLAEQTVRVASMLDLMREVFSALSSSNDGQLTRLHLHTLAFQALVVKRGSAWRRNRAAATKAALTATRHVCAHRQISVEASTVLMDDGFLKSDAAGSERVMFNAQEPVACWQEDELDVEVCVAPVLVCTAVKQTAGAGDNISAAGLVLQV